MVPGREDGHGAQAAEGVFHPELGEVWRRQAELELSRRCGTEGRKGSASVRSHGQAKVARREERQLGGYQSLRRADHPRPTNRQLIEHATEPRLEPCWEQRFAEPCGKRKSQNARLGQAGLGLE